MGRKIHFQIQKEETDPQEGSTHCEHQTKPQFSFSQSVELMIPATRAQKSHFFSPAVSHHCVQSTGGKKKAEQQDIQRQQANQI